MEAYATADQVWAGGLIFARIGAVLMLIPGIGEAYVPPRVRLSLALLITLALWPVVRTTLPPLPESLASMVGWIIREAVVGLIPAFDATARTLANPSGERDKAARTRSSVGVRSERGAVPRRERISAMTSSLAVRVRPRPVRGTP